MGWTTNGLDGSKGRNPDFNACSGRRVPQKLEAISNGKSHSVSIIEEVLWAVDEAAEGCAPLVVFDSS